MKWSSILLGRERSTEVTWSGSHCAERHLVKTPENVKTHRVNIDLVQRARMLPSDIMPEKWFRDWLRQKTTAAILFLTSRCCQVGHVGPALHATTIYWSSVSEIIGNKAIKKMPLRTSRAFFWKAMATSVCGFEDEAAQRLRSLDTFYLVSFFFDPVQFSFRPQRPDTLNSISICFSASFSAP